MDSGEGLLVERGVFQAGEGEVMVDVEFHTFSVDRLEMGPGHDA